MSAMIQQPLHLRVPILLAIVLLLRTSTGDSDVEAADCLISAPKALPASVVDAWEGAGFQVGWMRENRVGAPVFNAGVQGAPGDVPAFKLQRHSQRPMASLPPPETAFGLCFHNRGVGNAALQDLPAMKHLQMLDLTGSAVTDEGLPYLTGIRNLRGLSHLAGLENLQRLGLHNTDVTDAGLQHLGELRNLRLLLVSGSRVTDAGFKKLQESLPACTSKWPHLKVRVVNQDGLSIAGVEVLVYREVDSLGYYPTRAKTDGLGWARLYPAGDSFHIRLTPSESRYEAKSIVIRRSDDESTWKAAWEDTHVQVRTLKDNNLAVVVALQSDASVR